MVAGISLVDDFIVHLSITSVHHAGVTIKKASRDDILHIADDHDRSRGGLREEQGVAIGVGLVLDSRGSSRRRSIESESTVVTLISPIHQAAGIVSTAASVSVGGGGDRGSHSLGVSGGSPSGS